MDHTDRWQVPWASLVPGRDEAAVRRRWLLMAKVVPQYRDKEMGEVGACPPACN